MSGFSGPPSEAGQYRWVAEHQRLMPDLYFVLRHSGRDGDPWRVLYETRAEAEARKVFSRKAYGGSGYGLARTVLCHGGTDTWENQIDAHGLGARNPGLGTKGTIEAARAREKREAKAAARATRQRPRVRIETDEERAERAAYLAFRKAHPATRREENGDVDYIHDLLPGQAFPTAKGATTLAYAVYVTAHQRVAEPKPQRVRIAVVVEESAEQEAVAAEEQTATRRRAA